MYCEKPCTKNIAQSLILADTMRRTGRVFQAGTQRRNLPHFAFACELARTGKLGKLKRVYAHPMGMTAVTSGWMPAEAEPDKEVVDWDMYLGPAPEAAFNDHRFLGTFRWYYDYAGGRITDWGTHRFDSMRQVMQADSPLSVVATGGLYALKDGRDTPDILQVTYQFPEFVLSYEANMLNSFGLGVRTPDRPYYRANGPADRPNGMAFYGTSGTIFADRLGFEVFPEVSGGGRGRGRRGGRGAAPAEVVRESGSTSEAESLSIHTANVVDCIRTRNKPVADVEIGHLSSALPHLGNVAYKCGRQLKWDAEKEVVTGDEEATQLLGRVARRPWDMVTV
jgi:predicted dehydrogenase